MQAAVQLTKLVRLKTIISIRLEKSSFHPCRLMVVPVGILWASSIRRKRMASAGAFGVRLFGRLSWLSGIRRVCAHRIGPDQRSAYLRSVFRLIERGIILPIKRPSKKDGCCRASRNTFGTMELSSAERPAFSFAARIRLAFQGGHWNNVPNTVGR